MIFVFILIFIAFLVSFKVVYNYRRYNRLKFLLCEFQKWILKKENVFENDFMIHKAEIIELLEQAQLKNVYIKLKSDDETANAVKFQLNMLDRELVDTLHTEQIIKEAIGKYQLELKKSKSVGYWIEAIVFLPRNLLNYLGLDKNSVSTKCLNVVLTFIYWAFSIGMVLCKDEIIDMIKSLMK